MSWLKVILITCCLQQSWKLGSSFLNLQNVQERSNFGPNTITRAHYMIMKREDLVPCSEHCFYWKKYISRKKSSLNLFADNYWQNNQLSLQFHLGKSRPVGQMASLLDMPAGYFKDSVMKREIRLGVYRQDDQGRTKKVPIDFFNINQKQHRKQHL